MKDRKPAILLVSWATLLVTASLATSLAAPTSDELAWLKKNVLPLKTCEAGQGFEDLAPLKNLVGNAHIVSLDECTHGTREVFQMKHRLLEYLARECGFTIFAIEANMPEAHRLNGYVLKGTGDPARLIGGMYFWTWNTEEVLAMVQWMREFNQTGKGRLEFTGFDMQTPDVAMEMVLGFLKEHDPVRLKATEELYQKIKQNRLRLRGGGGGQFGAATGRFPVEEARGRKVRYSGWIKTAGVTGGSAGLWWRADGVEGVLAFDNMAARGINGDTEWKQYELELTIPKETVNINFGMLLAGQGKAWFDDLKVEIGGQEYDPAGRFDFGFESGNPKGFSTGGDGYRTEIDDQVARVGRRSLRIEFAGTEDPKAAESPIEREAVARQCGRVVQEMEAGRDRYAEAALPEAADWAVQNARVVHQYALMEAQQASRDESMARNVKWTLDHAAKGAKIVLWAHNGHVARGSSFGYQPMGAFLDKRYGKDQVVIGFSAGEGQYTAIVRNKGLSSNNQLQPPPKESYEDYFRASGIPRFIVDLRKAAENDAGSGWLTRPLPFRSIGAVAMDEQFALPTNLRKQYDAVIYLDKTTASRPLPVAWRSQRKN